MPRCARAKSETGYYHVILRGINRQRIFIDGFDNERFLSIVERHRNEMGFTIPAYCLMSNHVHMLIGDSENKLDVIMKKIAGSYARYFNRKYDRVGHVFQDRFKSEPINDQRYFLSVLRYIHQNPVKAGIATVSDYPWNSYRDYFARFGLADTRVAIEMLGGTDEFLKFVEIHEPREWMDTNDSGRVNDEVAMEIIKNVAETDDLVSIRKMDKQKRKEILSILIDNGVSKRQIERILHISRKTLYDL